MPVKPFSLQMCSFGMHENFRMRALSARFQGIIGPDAPLDASFVINNY